LVRYYRIEGLFFLLDKKALVFGVLFSLGVGGLFSSGFYSLNIVASEMVHFHVNFPVSEGKTAGGLGPPGGFRGQLQPVVVNIAKEGLPKKVCCPWIVGISTHWITNLSEKEYTIRLELVNCSMRIDWICTLSTWDPQTKTIRQKVSPCQRVRGLSLDIYFHIEPELRDVETIYEGGLRIVDAETGEVLSYLPIKIVVR